MTSIVGIVGPLVESPQMQAKQNFRDLYVLHEKNLLLLASFHFPEHLGSMLQLVLDASSNSKLAIQTWASLLLSLKNNQVLLMVKPLSRVGFRLPNWVCPVYHGIPHIAVCRSYHHHLLLFLEVKGDRFLTYLSYSPFSSWVDRCLGEPDIYATNRVL